MRVGRLMEGEEGGQFPGQKEGTKLLREKSVGKRGVEQSRGGQSRIRRGRVFRGQVLFAVVRRRRLRGWWKVQWQ